MFKKIYKPSKTEAVEFANKMKEISEYCIHNGIDSSISKDSYYFSVNGTRYRISNHTIAKSNKEAFRDGIKMRDEYHPEGEEEDTVYITASKTRLIEIHKAILDGKALNRRGRVI